MQTKINHGGRSLGVENYWADHLDIKMEPSCRSTEKEKRKSLHGQNKGGSGVGATKICQAREEKGYSRLRWGMLMDVQNVRKNGWEGALPPAEMWMPGSLVQGIDAACLRASKEGADGSQQKGELRCMEYSSHGHLKKQERHPPRQTSRGRQDPKEVGNGEMQGCKIKLVLGSLHK
eukprot:1149350-Pelagomonas_calceolata.AAC.1